MFKVNYIVKDKIEKIYIFYGSHKINDGVNKIDPNQLYKIEPTNPLFSNIFSKEELENIEKEQIEVELVEQYIHLDDTVETIKQKIQHAFSNTILFEEIYMFYVQETMMDTNKVYKQLTQNKKKRITIDSMIGFLLNFLDLENKSPEPKSNYTLDDLYDLDIVGNKRLKKTLGHRLTSSMFNYSFTSNPYELVTEDPYIKDNVHQMISTSNSNLLMDFGKVYDNNIYLVLGNDIINENTSPTFINTYFPFLFNADINTREDYDRAKPEMLEKQNINELSFKTNDLFYNIYKDEKSAKNNYLSHGIYSIQFTKFQSDSVQLPLETIFKLIHSTQNIPMIQFIAGQKKEPIYRLYVDKYSKDGKKIPFLSKKKIIQIINSMSSAKAITYYIHTVDNVHLRCEINTKGEIGVLLQLRELLSVKQVDLLIKTYINPILVQIQNYMKQSGYVMTLFNSLYDTDIEVNNINYKFNIEMTKRINFASYMGCVSSVFNIISSKLENNIVMKFKKVSNFNKMSSHEELITKLINQSFTNKDIIGSLKSNFDYTDEKALDIFNKFVEEKAIERDLHENRKLKVKEQPGFDIIVKHDKFTSNIIIDVTGINNILYLKTLPIYIDSLLKINNETVSDEYKEDVNGLCKRSVSKTIESSKKNDIIAAVEKPKQAAIFESSKMMGSEMDNIDDLFDAFYDDDDDDDQEEEANYSENGFIEPKGDEFITNDENDEDDENDENDEDDEDDEDDGLMVFGGSDNDDESERKELVGILDQAKTKKKKLKVIDGSLIKDIEGMSLSNPNYFFERMNDRDPVLFLKRKTDNFSSYSRSCASNMLRQPVSLTDSEKEKIDKEHPGSYSHAVKYGSTPDKKFWYICPRYWCLKSNTSISDKEVDDGVCGGRDAIIPSDAKTVPKGKYIFEFNAPAEHHDTKGEYITHHPGFMPSSKHPDNLCIPCCFKKWNEAKIKKCIPDDVPLIKSVRDDVDRETYVLGQDKFPLESGRLGHLPVSIQMFLNTDSTKCYGDKGPNTIKNSHPCLIRYGVEYSDNQSFLYCLADFISSDKKKATIKDVKDKIMEVVTIDNFITYHNGNLVELFKPKNIDYIKTIASYYTTGKTKSSFYEKLNKSSPEQIIMFKQIIASYEIFLKYISDEKSIIDHTYIWDIICTPNNFFIDGLNLIIMEIADDDITNNVNVYCPTNHYSNNFFDIEKNTLLMIKTNNIYEPVYVYTEDKKKHFTKYFNFTNPSLLPNLKTFLLEIQKYFTNCKPLRSSPRIYTFKNNMVLDDLENEIKKINGQITDYIVNYNSKIVAVKITLDSQKMSGVLPCHPSAIKHNDINIVFIDNIDIWSSYSETRDFLYKVKSMNEIILCEPHSKVMDDGLMIGILTETNQFIMINQPTEFIDDDITNKIDDSNYISIDSKIITSTNDSPKDEFVRNVKLETNFYNSFKNLTRTVINKIDNRSVKTSLQSYISDSKDTYPAKLEHVITLIRTLLSNYISFSYYSEEVLKELTYVTSCLDNSTCADNFCLKSGASDCKLNIPQKNLINGLDNETVYYARISDEILRFNRVKSFIFEPDIYLSFLKINYDLSDTEIVLMQSSILGRGYLDGLEYEQQNTYIVNNTFDTIQPDPVSSQKYSDVIKNEQINQSDIEQAEILLTTIGTSSINGIGINKRLNIIEDSPTDIQKSSSPHPDIKICKSKVANLDKKLEKFFPEDFKNLEYDRDINCGIQLIHDIFKLNKIQISKHTIMKELYTQYSKYFEKYQSTIYSILKNQGKTDNIEKVEQNIISFEDYIMSEEYFITELDMLLIMLHHNIDIMLLDNTVKRGSTTTINFVPNKYNDQNDYYIIANYSYINVPKFKILFDSPNYKADFGTLQSFFRTKSEIRPTICNSDIINMVDYNIETHYLESIGKKQKKKLLLREADP